MKIALLSGVLLVIFCGVANAEIWSCAPAARGRAPVYTNTPVTSDASRCARASLSTTAFNRLPDAATPRILEHVPGRAPTVRSTRKYYPVKYSVTDSTPEQFFRKVCRIRGMVEYNGLEPLTVEITRGGATVNKLELSTVAGKKQRFQIELRGQCLKPVLRAWSE